MPHVSSGFTPINLGDASSAPQPASTTQQKRGARRGSEARRRRKNPLIQQYLSPGKSTGASMFERAAISHGEEPQLKKRKTTKGSEGDKKQHAEPEKQARPKPNAGGRRVVSEGMRTATPFAFAPVKPQDAAFNPRSAADKLVTSSGKTPLTSNTAQDTRSSAMDDNIAVVSPLTSMDVLSARPASRFGFESVPAHGSNPQKTSRNNFKDSSPTKQHKISLTNHLGDVERRKSPRLNHSLQHLSDSRTLLQPTPSSRRSYRLSRSPRLDTIIEEVQADSFPVIRNKDSSSSLPSAVHHDPTEREPNEFDVFDDGLSDLDLFRSVELNEVQQPQKDTCASATIKLTSEENAESTSSQAVAQFDVEETFFAEDWELFEDEDIDVLEEAEASMDSATILNQVSGNVQKVQASPTSISASGTDAQSIPSPDLKPIARPAFPNRVQERSPVLGVSAALSLRVCFRIGEALNVGSQALREHQSVIIELYARVRWSFREPRSAKQHFIFMDLFHDRPPYLDGTYQCWKGVELYERDSGRFLERSERPLICRCVGKLKRDGTSWRLTILNIWEASMDDVKHVVEIIQS